jgi:hypothetical protein
VELAFSRVGGTCIVWIDRISELFDVEALQVNTDLYIVGEPDKKLRIDMTDATCRRLYIDRRLDAVKCSLTPLGDSPLFYPGPHGKRCLDGVVYNGFGLASHSEDDFSFPDVAGDYREATVTFVNLLNSQADNIGRPNPDSYRQLAEALRSRGYDSDARFVSREMEKALARASDQWLWRYCVGPITGWGYEPLQAGGVLLALWLAGSLLFWTAECRIVPTETDDAKARSPSYPRFWPPLYALDVMSPLIQFGQDKAYCPRSGDWWLVASVHLLRVLGWWLVTIVAVGLTGILKTH